ncbi:DUF262 domain-containing protein [Coleofasciculus sp. FACHB-64]|uniref:DUF262 domain-containing protein n=1 Tax=Cyanophyceae TaxID=3028117 RepID=UPI001683CAFD|nr:MULTISPECIES: DUF262 domain-containing protein [unclassified Coleofasciculus]MBD1893321.1 DUF262 domain-containing protein [Coleofasciculus sp. FACHB-129]MBD2044370.1 DUF262 domain-containing protein [Coleofasciculus sp. FACHB-64]
MSTVKIQATEYPIQKVFSNDFVFTIPLYQRPYAWTTEQAGELLQDLIVSLGDGNEPIDDINPYFLGSIVLIKADKPDAQVVDGQQRLSTLTILLSALRTLVQPKYANALTKLLYEESDPILGYPNRYRLTLAKRDAEFFKEYIQDEGGISKLESLHSTALSDSRKNIKENALLFLKELGRFSESQRVRLVQFIITRCFLVVVSTPDLESAYRIFSVLNGRGLDLSLPDILKAEIIGQIPDDQKEAYTCKWEDIQEKLGRETFEDLFSYIRMIARKAKLTGSILKEYREHIKPWNNSQEFIKTTLCPLADAFYKIKNTNYVSDKHAEEVNKLFKQLNDIDNSDWIPPAILYLSRNHSHPERLVKFFTELERLAAGLMIKRANINERIERYRRLLTAIEHEEDLYTPDSPLQITSEEKNDILKMLDGDLYLTQKIRLFVLLRLDAALSEGEASYNFPTITVEHILPQNPAHDSLWVKSFTSLEEREKYVHRLGNLALLSCYKNSEAQNYDFDVKKQKYFTTKKGVSPFALTTQVLMEQEWTPEVIEARQKKLIGVLQQVWRLE